MKMLSPPRANRALTLLEVLLVLLVITVAAAMLLPATTHGHRTPLISCLNNVKQIDLGFLLYAQGNDGRVPIQTSTTNGGTMEFLERNQTFPHYQKLSQYILYTRVFVCPSDLNRQAATDYANLSDTNLSYFLNADVSTNNPATSIVAGDRNLQADGQPVRHGTFTLRTNMNLAWTSDLHRTTGVLGFADGHADMCRATSLNPLLQQQGLAAVRLSVP